MNPDGRADNVEHAERINAAAELLAAGSPVNEAVAMLADRFGCSPRQARRYVHRAQVQGRVAIPSVTTVFTVKLPVELVAQVRAHAAESGRSISGLVAQALQEFLLRGHRQRPGR
jgi:hypothetical protein